ncbi:hypothetical protein LEA_18141 [human gut metagenome]|uniref:Methyl-accepting chemotaxis protein n=1 Tax=human gut metagenome TaxID=408170 RepID=K1RMX0_9ZZZZ
MENISQLSAVTEEVTANAEQVHTMSQNNLDCAEQVKTAVEHIRSTTDEMGNAGGVNPPAFFDLTISISNRL